MCPQSTPPATSIPKIFLPPLPCPLPPLAIYLTYGIVSFHVTLLTSHPLLKPFLHLPLWSQIVEKLQKIIWIECRNRRWIDT